MSNNNTATTVYSAVADVAAAAASRKKTLKDLCEIVRRHRRDELHATHKEPTPLPVVPDNARTAEAIMRRARNLGVGPMEAFRRYMDDEARRVAARLAELEGGR